MRAVGAGFWQDRHVGGPRNVGREIAVSLAIGALFAAGLIAYLRSSMVPPSPPQLVAGADRERGSEPLLAAENALVSDFASALAGQRYEDAYALMAGPYREGHSLAAFRERCAESRFLSGIERAAVVSTRQTRIPGAQTEPRTVMGRGVVTGKVGSIDALFTFYVEGERRSLLVLELAGSPVLDGIGK